MTRVLPIFFRDRGVRPSISVLVLVLVLVLVRGPGPGPGPASPNQKPPTPAPQGSRRRWPRGQTALQRTTTYQRETIAPVVGFRMTLLKTSRSPKSNIESIEPAVLSKEPLPTWPRHQLFSTNCRMEAWETWLWLM